MNDINRSSGEIVVEVSVTVDTVVLLIVTISSSKEMIM
jgi:hypothetical protein